MKKIILFATISTLILASCHNNKPDLIEKISVSVQLNLPAGAIIPSSYNMQFIDLKTGHRQEVNFGSSGAATFNLIPGLYNAIIKAEASDEDNYTYLYSGSLVNEFILQSGKHYSIDVSIAKASPLVFKEIFYCGNASSTGVTYFHGQFYEIYNQSRGTVYVDGLCIGQFFTLLAEAVQPLWEIAGKYPGNQNDYVYGLTLHQVPGSGKEYPLEPGESIIIAKWGRDHRGASDTSLDLSSAEFEVYIPPSTVQTDEPAINTNIFFISALSVPTNWLATVFGSAYAIFFPDETVNPENFVLQQGTSTRGLPIPLDLILDAVECVGTAASVQLKRFPAVLDAGAIHTNGGIYVNESIARKIESIRDDGVIIFQDTNNSTDDFEVMSPPMIRRYGVKWPSWNTWGKK